MASTRDVDKDGRKVLYESAFFEVVSIEWSREKKSAMHNHGWSQCFVSVEEGVFENTLDLGVKTERQALEVGQVLETPVGAHHEMRCLTPRGRTLHVYTPKISELTETGKFNSVVTKSLKDDLQLSEATSWPQLKKTLDQIRLQSISTHSPYFMNQLFSGIFPQTLIAEDLVNQTKTTMATCEASPVFSMMESEVIRSLGELIGWRPSSRDGVSVPGGSAANFMALHLARQKKFPNFKKSGMNGSPLKIFVSAEAHYSFKKGCAALGFGTDNLVLVAADSRGRMDPQDLEKKILEEKKKGGVPFFVSATSGTTVLGAFDPLIPLADLCEKYGVWFHVDGAWGGPALFSKKLNPLVQGIDRSDSVTFDAHKLFGASLTCSFLLTKQAGLLLEANDVSGGDYLFHPKDEEIDRGRASWQCGRKADAVSFWTIWKNLGTEGLGSFVDRLLDVRNETLTWLKTQNRFELVHEPEFLNLCLRVAPPRGADAADWSRKVRESLKEQNLAMVNYSTDEKGHFLRLILANPFLQFSHVKQILEWSLLVE